MPKPPVILSRWYEFAKWLLERVDNFPKSQRVIPGRTRRILKSPDITGFTQIGTLNPGIEETDKLFQDTGAASGKEFYKVEISKP